jgi:hypothetical protein
MKTTVVGDTFGRSETVTVYYDGQAVTTAPTTSGSFSATFKVPFSATFGQIDVMAVGSAGNLATAKFFAVF